MRKDFRDFVRQCELCQANKERNFLPTGDAQTLPFPSEIFSSYAIDCMGPFTKLKGQDSVLVVVDRAVGFSWLIPTSVTATAVQTTELLRHPIFRHHGVRTSIVSDANSRFTSKFWKQTLKTMGLEHIMAAPGHHQTNGQAAQRIREIKTALRNVTNLHQANWLTSLPEVAACSNAGHSDTINMSPYKAVYGGDYPVLDIYRVYSSAVLASDTYYNRHQEIRNAAYQALNLARVRSTKTAAKRRDDIKPVEIWGMVIIFGDQFAMESSRFRKLQPQWRGPFIVIEFDDHTQNYTVSMNLRIYRRQRRVFYCSVVKPYHPNDNERFPGRAHTKPAPILIDNEKGWEIETILDHRTRHGRGQFLVKWKGYPNSENSWERMEGLENAEDLVQAWWTDNLPGEEVPTVFSGYLTVRFTPTKDGYEQHSAEPTVDLGFWEPHVDTDYDSEEI